MRELLDRSFPTSSGPLTLLAELDVHDETLNVHDLAVYAPSGERLAIGITALRFICRELGRDAYAAGFKRLHVIGKRLSGMSPGRAVDLYVDLERRYAQ